MKEDKIHRNSLEIYADAGARSGKAARQNDWTLSKHHYTWFRKALALESDKDYAKLAQEAFDNAYRDARITQK